MTPPRVAIGLVVYNGQGHLAAAIDSLLSQTMDDLVLDISDNGSTDQTEEICRSYAAADSRVRYVRHDENRGPTWNHNYVVRASPDTELFKWCADDDVYEPTYLERCVAELDERPELVACHSRVGYINEHGEELMRSFRQLHFDDDRPWARFEQVLVRPHDFSIAFAVIRRSALDRVRPFQPVYNSDAIKLAELAFLGPFGEVPEHLFLNRGHPGESFCGDPPRAYAPGVGQMVRRIEPVSAVAHLSFASPEHRPGSARPDGEGALLRRLGEVDQDGVDGPRIGRRDRRAPGSERTDSRELRSDAGTMKITELSIWEELGGLQGWSELAASCDASPFAWPSFCLPWWWELGWGRLASVVVEDSGLLVGLALIHDRVGDVGRHMLRFVGDEVGTYHQLLVAEDRDDVCEILLERILSSGREIDFSSIPLKLAHSYQAATSCPLVLTEQTTFGFVSVPVESPEPVSTDRIGPVRKVTDPAECLALITGPTEADRWGGGRGIQDGGVFRVCGRTRRHVPVG